MYSEESVAERLEAWWLDSIYKKNDKCSKENYRPITVLPRVDKVFEQRICMQVSTAFQGYIYEQSSAYRKANSCETTLINLVEEWKRARDNRLAVAILSTDMSKAFDSLHSPLLLSKLKAYGFQEGTIQLLNTNLCDRKYWVKIGSEIKLVQDDQSRLPWVHWYGIYFKMIYPFC